MRGGTSFWAREIPGVSLQSLLDYFRGRQVWIVEPDLVQPRLTVDTELPQK